MKKNRSSTIFFLEIVSIILKLFMVAIAGFLILFGIHWVAILSGISLMIIYFILSPQPKETAGYKHDAI